MKLLMERTAERLEVGRQYYTEAADSSIEVTNMGNL